MNVTDFCVELSKLSLSSTDQALAVLWFFDDQKVGAGMSSGDLTRIIFKSGLGNPHSTKLAERLKKSGAVLSTASGFQLKPLHKSKLAARFGGLISKRPLTNHEKGYLPKAVWHPTRGFIHKVCEQLNGCYEAGYYDAACVLARRLVETLIIECYVTQKREAEIQGSDGNYLMLRDLANVALNKSPLNLGRDAKKALPEVKEIGDRSAHTPRFNAVQADLDKLQSGLRVLVDELIHIWSVRTT